MSHAMHDQLAMLSRFVGRHITKLERILYEFERQIEEDDGDVQIWFGEDSVRLGSSPDGASLVVNESPWADPFSGRLSDENEEYVRTHGKWTLVDVSERGPYAQVIDRDLTAVLPLTSRFGSLIGVQLRFDDIAFNVFVHADEVHVSWGRDNIPRWGHEWGNE
jgi:hypothetical protein